LQSWIDEVVNGYSSNDSSALNAQYSCSLDGSTQTPVLSRLSAAERGSNFDCIFLGKVIQATNDSHYSDHLYAYTVLGRRTVADTDSVQTSVTDISQANPTAAIFEDQDIDLTEDYLIPNGARVLSVKSGGLAVSGSSYMAGIFTGLSNISNGQQTDGANLQAYNYKLAADAVPRSDNVKDCIALKGGCAIGSSCPDITSATCIAQLCPSTGDPNCVQLCLAGDPNCPLASGTQPMKSLEICLGSTRSDDTALITLSSNGGVGIASKVEFKDCS
jgi:hypothetical protein